MINEEKASKIIMSSYEHKSAKARVVLNVDRDVRYVIEHGGRSTQVPMDYREYTMDIHINTDLLDAKFSIELTSVPLSDWHDLARADYAEIRNDDDDVIVAVSDYKGKLCYMFAADVPMMKMTIPIPVAWLQEPLSAAIADAIRLGAVFTDDDPPATFAEPEND